MEKVLVEKRDKVATVIINRPRVKNAVDRETADLLAAAFRDFDRDPDLHAAVLWGSGGTFCAGADLKGVAGLSRDEANRLNRNMEDDAPMGPTRLQLSKPVIAAVSGYAVAGGLELACWCDLRVVEEDAVFGVFCRRFGVPLVDGGTQRLPRLIGMSRAMDLILTGRAVGAEEAREMGLANRVVKTGSSRREAENLALQLSRFPQQCLRNDRRAAYEGSNRDLYQGMKQEFALGLKVIESGEAEAGASRFSKGDRGHGKF